MAYTTRDTENGGMRPVGYFSRRHETRTAQDTAREEYFQKHPNKKRHRKATTGKHLLK